MTFQTNKQDCLICKDQCITGITIFGETICLNCEQKLLEIDVDDPKYNDFLTPLKQLWFRSSPTQDPSRI